MTAAKHTVMLTVTVGTCDQCHVLSTLSFYGATNLTTRPSGHHVGQDCKGCHSPNNWGGGAAKRKAATAPTPTRTTVGTVVGPPAARSNTGSETASSSGTAALGPAPVTSLDCAACHTTFNWTVATPARTPLR